MSTDRDLLELAAKAVGIIVNAKRQAERDEAGFSHMGLWTTTATNWNPLDDNSDALRLAAKLELDVMHRVVSGRRIEVLAAGGPLMTHFYEGDVASAMRRAIVLCAAEIGRRMP